MVTVITFQWILKAQFECDDNVQLTGYRLQWSAVLSVVINLHSIKAAILTSQATVSFSRRIIFHGVSYEHKCFHIQGLNNFSSGLTIIVITFNVTAVCWHFQQLTSSCNEQSVLLFCCTMCFP